MRYSWWTGRINFASDFQNNEAPDSSLKVALVVGITDMVGISLSKLLVSSDAPGGPWKVNGISRSSPSNWSESFSINFLQCNLLDLADVEEKIGALQDVTHLFWVPCIHFPANQEEHVHTVTVHMFQNVVNALMAHADHLQHICLQTSDKHYTMNSTVMLDPPFSEHMPRLHTLNVYHSLEDILLNAVAKKEGVTWSIHRPSIVLGFSPWSYTNLIGSLAMYATICKHEGLPFQFLGNKKSWERFVDAADANLIASQEVWACLDQNGKNQVFNVANGDVISVKRLWKVVADEFGLEVPTPYYGKTITTLEEVMSEKDEVWDEIVRIHDLHTTKLSEVGCWWYVDSVLNATSSSVLNLNKSKELGFTSFRNTEVAIIHWIHELRRKRFIP